MSLFEIKNLRQVYGDRVVLDIDALALKGDGITALIGPNGAGKSTLLRLLAGLEHATHGEVSCAVGDVRSRVMVFQRPLLLTRSVSENVAYGLAIRGVGKEAITRRVAAALDQAGLASLAGAGANTLSGGEYQRAALARALALAINAPILLLDEPGAHLDPGNGALIEQMIKTYQADNSAAVILATHNLHQARRLADRVVMLHEGRVIADQPVAEFFSAPGHPLAAAFIQGEMQY
jgi:tungstate transport system ATP-binding protein